MIKCEHEKQERCKAKEAQFYVRAVSDIPVTFQNKNTLKTLAIESTRVTSSDRSAPCNFLTNTNDGSFLSSHFLRNCLEKCTQHAQASEQSLTENHTLNHFSSGEPEKKPRRQETGVLPRGRDCRCGSACCRAPPRRPGSRGCPPGSSPSTASRRARPSHCRSTRTPAPRTRPSSSADLDLMDKINSFRFHI